MHRKAVLQIAGTHASARPDPGSLRALPTPVRKYLEFALPDPGKSFRLANIKAEGQFSRPLMESFAPTTASQTIAVRTPALLFDAKTPIIPGLWARAYDFFADGKMEMRAKILAAITVVDEGATDALNRTSLRRWLLESPLYPMELLPGDPVRWEAIDDTHARAVSRLRLQCLPGCHLPPGRQSPFQRRIMARENMRHGAIIASSRA